jgi:hypothetical protein
MPFCAAVRGRWYPIKLPDGYFKCGSTLIAHEKSQEGSKGGNGFLHVLGGLPVVGSKATVDHFRLVNLQADGEGESGATSKIL